MSALALLTIQTQINCYYYPVVMVLGCIGNLFILILFSQQRHNACSIYLVNSAVTSLLHLTITGFLSMFRFVYNDGSMRALILCKVSNYIPSSFGQVIKTILILACIDRYMITSHRATLRAFGTPKRAKYLVCFTYIFWLVVTSYEAVFTTISNGQCIRAGIYATIYTFYALLLVGLIPSVILSIFACLTYRNLKHLRRRIQPAIQGAGHTNHKIQRRDRDLLVLVIAEVVVYIITAALFPAVLLEIMVIGYVLPMKSAYYSIAEWFAFNVAIYLLYMFSAAPFYIYIVSSAIFRRDFRQLIVTGYGKLARRGVDQPAPRIHQAIIQRETRV